MAARRESMNNSSHHSSHSNSPAPVGAGGNGGHSGHGGARNERGVDKQKVRVICRVRPLNQKELNLGGMECITQLTESTITLQENGGATHPFTLDAVFEPQATQQSIFEDAAKPLIADVMEGYNATIFAYGQTSSGKTHTMEGPDIWHPEQRGIIPRSVEAIFEYVAQSDPNLEFTLRVSYIEIYMEKIRDLLDVHRVKTNLAIREDKDLGVYVAGVTEEYVTSQEELLDIMHKGAVNRATAATGMNAGSSRSHSVFTVTIHQRDTVSNVKKTGKLTLIDLAGSEMVKKTLAAGQQLDEAKTINKSLSALGQVINALTDDKVFHVPYRDSKLTRVLQDSLGGNSKTVLIVAISPSTFNTPESLSTLRFGSRAKNIENKAKVNATRSVEELEALLAKAEATIERMSIEILSLKSLVGDGHQATPPPRQPSPQDSSPPATAATAAETPAGESAPDDEDYADDTFEADPPPPSPTKAINAAKEAEEAAVAATAEVKSQLAEARAATEKALAANATLKEQAAASAVLLRNLQEKLEAQRQQLEDEQGDSQRKDGELNSLSALLDAKTSDCDRLTEALEEAHKMHEEQCEATAKVQAEKAALVSSFEESKAELEATCSRLRYEELERESSIETLRAENSRMAAEIADMSGDRIESRISSDAAGQRSDGDEAGAGAGAGADKVEASAQTDLGQADIEAKSTAGSSSSSSGDEGKEGGVYDDDAIRNFSVPCTPAGAGAGAATSKESRDAAFAAAAAAALSPVEEAHNEDKAEEDPAATAAPPAPRVGGVHYFDPKLCRDTLEVRRGEFEDILRHFSGVLGESLAAVEGGKKSDSSSPQPTAQLREFTTALSTWHDIQAMEQSAFYGSMEVAVADSGRLAGKLTKHAEDLEAQRSKLAADLQDKVVETLKLEAEIEAIRESNPDQLRELYEARDKPKLSSLQQRLEQLVAVHRQLLRRYSSLELENKEFRKKLQIRDDRIRSLESNNKQLVISSRSQGDRYLQELAGCKDMIEQLKTEHLKLYAQQEAMAKAAAAKQAQYSGGARLVGGGGAIVGGGGGGASASGAGPKTLRGGTGGAPTPAAQSGGAGAGAGAGVGASGGNSNATILSSYASRPIVQSRPQPQPQPQPTSSGHRPHGHHQNTPPPSGTGGGAGVRGPSLNQVAGLTGGSPVGAAMAGGSPGEGASVGGSAPAPAPAPRRPSFAGSTSSTGSGSSGYTTASSTDVNRPSTATSGGPYAGGAAAAGDENRSSTAPQQAHHAHRPSVTGTPPAAAPHPVTHAKGSNSLTAWAKFVGIPTGTGSGTGSPAAGTSAGGSSGGQSNNSRDL